jgi:2,4-dienoyl-CoA reductase-like NADH-dependent reductase (Old Yellow Enzyme family)
VNSALTRQRCTHDGIPNELHVEYYSSRASYGLILTECSGVSPDSDAFPGSAGIYTDAQVEGWKKVTDAVHYHGGKIIH